MIAIHAIVFATMMRFLSLRPERSCCCNARQSACSTIIDASLEDVSKTIDSLAAVVPARCSFAIIGKRVTREVTVPQADYEPLFFSVNKLIPNDGANWRQLHPFDARLFETESESNFTPVPEWRLCMAASRRTQHKKRASRTKRLLFKTNSCIAQIIEERAATRRARFSFCRPISFKHLGKL